MKQVVCIPSRGFRKTNFLRKRGGAYEISSFPVFVFVWNFDYEQYMRELRDLKNYTVIDVGEMPENICSKIAYKRQFILDFCRKNGFDDFIMIDDDLKMLMCRKTPQDKFERLSFDDALCRFFCVKVPDNSLVNPVRNMFSASVELEKTNIARNCVRFVSVTVNYDLDAPFNYAEDFLISYRCKNVFVCNLIFDSFAPMNAGDTFFRNEHSGDGTFKLLRYLNLFNKHKLRIRYFEKTNEVIAVLTERKLKHYVEIPDMFLDDAESFNMFVKLRGKAFYN